ncbi:MAG TPA: hypothetical protein VJH03_18510 [Blastocatellia bacterium]|nr:hypothetical protein [Blastocatellia bacterium]
MDSSRSNDTASPPLTSARRLLVIGGIVLIAAGMIFGDVFAVFVLHQNASRVGEQLTLAADSVAAQNPEAVKSHFATLGALMENRGTKVDTHVHAIDFGYLALLLALVAPYARLEERRKKFLAGLFLTGSVMLPVSVFLIHYVGLTYSPLSSIGWASITADLGGLLVIIACAGFLIGVWRHIRRAEGATRENAGANTCGDWAGRALLTGGTLLVLAGFLHGAHYAVVDLDEHEARDRATLQEIVDSSRKAQMAPGRDITDAHRSIEAYGMLQAEKAVKIAAHSHIIEFGLLAMLLAFIQHYVFLSERWKRRLVVVMLAGSIILPVFVLLELKWGLIAGGIADAGGLLVVISLIGMLAGVVRHTGKADGQREAA